MEAIGVLSGGIAHDFNNVLATILANAELALEMVYLDMTTSADMEVAEMLNDIVAASIRAGSFCKQMLAYAGQGTIRKSRFDIGALIPQIGRLLQASLPKKATLEYLLHDEPTYIEGDESQLLQVIMNLVTNASEAIGNNEGQIVVSSCIVHYDTETLSDLVPDLDLPSGEYVRVAVSDTGCGMDSATVTRVFDPFFTTKPAGSGLGLAAVIGIVRGHGGTIQIESELEQGTTFTVILPTRKAPEHLLTESVPVAARVSPKCILVADDEPELRSILCKQLRFRGFSVVEASSGQQTIDAFRRDPTSIDCILLDFNMPMGDGEEIHRELIAIRQDVRILIMSGCSEQYIRSRLDGASNVVGFLQKPIGAVDLLEAIRMATTDP
jgi:CheY-like chemotaxis protein